MKVLIPFFHLLLSVAGVEPLWGCDSDFVLYVQCMVSLFPLVPEKHLRSNFVQLKASKGKKCLAPEDFYYTARETSVVIYSNGELAYLFAVVYFDDKGVLVERTVFPQDPQAAMDAGAAPGAILVRLTGANAKHEAHKAVEFILHAEAHARTKGAGVLPFVGGRLS